MSEKTRHFDDLKVGDKIMDLVLTETYGRPITGRITEVNKDTRSFNVSYPWLPKEFVTCFFDFHQGRKWIVLKNKY